MDEITLKRDDVIKQMYFILALAQGQDSPMHSRTGGKDDYIGGIIDRFINTLPESTIFTEIIFPKIKTDKKIELVRDFYNYSPGKTKIAPDLLGIKVNDKIIPFAIFDEKWKPNEKCPQVEIKTLKEKQYMTSLVDQGYEKSYIIFIESDLKIDYLMPFINKELFPDEIYNEMIKELDTYNKTIIKSDKAGVIKPLKKLNFEEDTLGKIRIKCITKATDYTKKANLAGKGISPEFICEIEKQEKRKNIETIPLSHYCRKQEKEYYRFNENWYNNKNEKGQYTHNSEEVVTLDFYCSDISNIDVLKINKGNFYIRINKKVIFNKEELEEGDYKLVFKKPIDRKSNQVDEYFLDKKLYDRIENCEESLLKELRKIIEKV